MQLEDIMKVVKEEDFDVTLTGGDPLFDPVATLLLARAIKEAGYNIWLYTGYEIEEIKASQKLRKVLDYVDVVVDGPYIEALRDPDLPFCGSSNQKIVVL